MKILITASVLLLMCTAAMAGEPCCAIKAIDVQNGIVTAADNHSGTTFRFHASSADARKLKTGQAVTAIFRTRPLPWRECLDTFPFFLRLALLAAMS
jgi:hypothetical protein